MRLLEWKLGHYFVADECLLRADIVFAISDIYEKISCERTKSLAGFEIDNNITAYNSSATVDYYFDRENIEISLDK